MCFDKTGTLTEDSIDFSGLVPVVDNQFAKAIRDARALPEDNRLLLSLATCHSLSVRDGKVDGQNLDIKLFESIDWIFFSFSDINDEKAFDAVPERIVGPKRVVESFHNNCTFYGIVKQFPFESVLQRILVVVCRAFDNKYLVVAKGAPEVIVGLCDPSSVPQDFCHVLESYTRDGLRVLASASKELTADAQTIFEMSREELESHMTFDGLVVFQNKLKKQTIPVVKTLNKASIRSIMLTGDNLLTSISVARESGLISESESVIKVEAKVCQSLSGDKVLQVSYTYAKLAGFSEKLGNGGFEESLLPLISRSERYHLAMEGRTFEMISHHDHDLLDKTIHKGTIFARMSPEHKLSLIRVLQQQGHQVGMCGDGEH